MPVWTPAQIKPTTKGGQLMFWSAADLSQAWFKGATVTNDAFEDLSGNGNHWQDSNTTSPKWNHLGRSRSGKKVFKTIDFEDGNENLTMPASGNEADPNTQSMQVFVVYNIASTTPSDGTATFRTLIAKDKVNSEFRLMQYTTGGTPNNTRLSFKFDSSNDDGYSFNCEPHDDNWNDDDDGFPNIIVATFERVSYDDRDSAAAYCYLYKNGEDTTNGGGTSASATDNDIGNDDWQIGTQEGNGADLFGSILEVIGINYNTRILSEFTEADLKDKIHAYLVAKYEINLPTTHKYYNNFAPSVGTVVSTNLSTDDLAHPIDRTLYSEAGLSLPLNYRDSTRR
jgi:hypothetical protein